jgi:hypothetical protein
MVFAFWVFIASLSTYPLKQNNSCLRLSLNRIYGISEYQNIAVMKTDILMSDMAAFLTI